MYDKIKGLLADDTVFYTLLILLVGVTSFGLGRSSIAQNTSKTQQQAAITMTEQAVLSTSTKSTSETPGAKAPGTIQGAYVASKNGSKYHLPWCSGAKQMSDANKIWFDTKEEAETAGYSKALNCPGL